MWDFIVEYILPIFLVILITLGIVVIVGATICLYKRDILNQEDYIQNIETKLNIYEQSYDNFVLEDSLKQSDIYE